MHGQSELDVLTVYSVDLGVGDHLPECFQGLKGRVDWEAPHTLDTFIIRANLVHLLCNLPQIEFLLLSQFIVAETRMLATLPRVKTVLLRIDKDGS